MHTLFRRVYSHPFYHCFKRCFLQLIDCQFLAFFGFIHFGCGRGFGLGGPARLAGIASCEGHRGHAAAVLPRRRCGMLRDQPGSNGGASCVGWYGQTQSWTDSFWLRPALR